MLTVDYSIGGALYCCRWFGSVRGRRREASDKSNGRQKTVLRKELTLVFLASLHVLRLEQKAQTLQQQLPLQQLRLQRYLAPKVILAQSSPLPYPGPVHQ